MNDWDMTKIVCLSQRLVEFDEQIENPKVVKTINYMNKLCYFLTSNVKLVNLHSQVK